MLTPICRVLAVTITLALGHIAAAQSLQTIHNFAADGSQGKNPFATLTIGPDGQLYGTATTGGANGDGTAFKISTGGIFTKVGDFETATTGRLPYARLVNIGDGILYGVTEANGNVAGDPAGTVYTVNPAGGLSVLRQLPSTGNPPMTGPRAIVSLESGFLHVLGLRSASIARVPLTGEAPTLFVLDTAAIGAFPYSMIAGADGKLYGHCEGTGGLGVSSPNARGSIFRVDANGANLVRLYEVPFPAPTGGKPRGAMVQAPDGNFYGTMAESAGGTSGVVFKMTPAGDYTVLHTFDDDLLVPRGDLMIATDGFLYGTTFSSGNTYGGVFRIRPDGTGYQVLHQFNNTDGGQPNAGLVQASDGHLYGTTTFGGTGNGGTIFRVTLDLPPPNRAPVALNDQEVSTGAVVVVNVLANDFDPEEDPLTIELETAPSFGTAEIQVEGSILYTPGAGFAGQDQFQYRITDPSGGSAVGTVFITATEPPASVLPGAYNGLLYLDPAITGDTDLPRGQLVISVSATGRFTGVVLAQKKRFSVRGIFDTDGTGIGVVKFSKKNAGVLFLGFEPGETGGLLGILFGREVWSGAVLPVRSSNSLEKKNYTVLVSADGVEAGTGYGIMQLAPNGLIRIVGKLGDGSKLAVGTTLVSAPVDQAQVPFFSEPLKGGVIGGNLPSSLEEERFMSDVRWIRPGSPIAGKPFASGFIDLPTITIDRYIAPATLDGVISLGDTGVGAALFLLGPTSPPILGSFQFQGNKIATELPLRSLGINRKNGLFKGRVQVESRTVPFNGAVNQNINAGFGHYFLDGSSGAVVIGDPDE